MAFTPGYRARVLNGEFSLSAYLNDASNALTVEMLDVTTFADNGNKRVIPGSKEATFAMSGFTDATVYADNIAWTDTQPLTYGHAGIANGAQVQMLNGLRSSFETGTTIGSACTFDLSGTADGPIDFGISLHDLTAVTTTENGTAYNSGGSATAGGGFAHLHVTAFSGLTNAIITIEDSANGSTWATVNMGSGGSGAFATVTGTTSERLAISGTIRQYLRYVATLTGTGSVTFSTAVARRS